MPITPEMHAKDNEGEAIGPFNFEPTPGDLIQYERKDTLVSRIARLGKLAVVYKTVGVEITKAFVRSQTSDTEQMFPSPE